MKNGGHLYTAYPVLALSGLQSITDILFCLEYFLEMNPLYWRTTLSILVQAILKISVKH